MAEDILEVHHQDGDRNNNRYANLALLHAHCLTRYTVSGIHDRDPCTEELDEAKVSLRFGSGTRAVARPTDHNLGGLCLLDLTEGDFSELISQHYTFVCPYLESPR